MTLIKACLLQLVLLSFIPQGHAQQLDVLDRILDDFTLYSELPREVAFVHLNKSVFIKGENLGFKAYVLDKGAKKPSLETRNLYCVLADSNDRMIKSQMVRITGGVGQGVFELDSLFHTGKYTFKAYTNWMRNFSEANYFQQSIDLLDPETHPTLPVTPQPADLEVQILPEGGHAVAGLPAVYGIIIKDTGGFGVPGVEGHITDGSGIEITRFKVNPFGIGRIGLTPDKGTLYFAHFRYGNREHRIPFPPAQPEGVGLRLTEVNDKVAIELNARFRDPSWAETPFFLTIHNGDNLKGIPVSFRDGLEQLKVFPKEDLYPGMNVFTLFDPTGKPLLERLFFNPLGLAFHENVVAYPSPAGDSLDIRLGIPGLQPGTFNSLSVSILPAGSQSNRSHHNLGSYTLLQPYVRGPIQNAGYYFQEGSAVKRRELDDLLLTQGWSSYDWNTVFNHPPRYRFDFEKGVSYTVGFNARSSDAFYIFPTFNNPSQLLELEPGQEEFTVENFYPLEGEKLALTEIRGNLKSSPAGAYVHFKPAGVPRMDSHKATLLPNRLGPRFAAIEVPPVSFENLKRLQMLDEVVVSEVRRIQRLEQLRDRSPGRVDIFAKDDPRRMMFLDAYLSGRGYRVIEGLGTLDILAGNPNSPSNPRPIVYLDGVLLTDFDLLWRFRLDIVDYIEINPTGIGSGIYGGGGVIRIVTNPAMARDPLATKAFQSYAIPLVFGQKKQFYTPVYSSYSSDFFRAFGTLGWVPDLQADPTGAIAFKAKPHGVEALELYVEGIINGNEFVSSRVLLETKAP
ncbi:hypothetical protein [Robiginitalea marina]|uniref:TonB-dependent receptor plug domain-containing protein n=1 Tax=Robiginitalea marina TaxID=2954105 RepID=A0ABT1AZM6_9FLAO|nr:hypothetical protein [Robiginitalea marina]MCO5725107.1 hypothetical protein [Robiginitalea marina]